MYKHLLIATDGSELAIKALSQGLGLAKALDARATVLMVSEPGRPSYQGKPRSLSLSKNTTVLSRPRSTMC